MHGESHAAMTYYTPSTLDFERWNPAEGQAVCFQATKKRNAAQAEIAALAVG